MKCRMQNTANTDSKDFPTNSNITSTVNIVYRYYSWEIHQIPPQKFYNVTA